MDNSDISDVLNQIVADAIKLKASDIHIEPRESDVLVRYRVDGILREVYTLEKELEKTLTFKLKIAAKIRTDQHFAPQDGRVSFEVGDVKVDSRLSILPTTKGEKIVIRLLTSKGRNFQLEDLGLHDKDLEHVKKSYKKPYGMILAVGPTGSGKTTTLYTILKLLNSKEVNITTVEDPVEYDVTGINHVQVNSKAELTFSNGLRSILRQDPDIIMVGEIRDTETARIAINAAMTGHLVLSTLHTNDAVTTIPRLIDMGIENFLVASTVNVVVAQRLCRRIDDQYKEEYELTAKMHEELQAERPDIASLLKPGDKLFKPKDDAVAANRGYSGRVGLYEVLQITEPIRDIINSNGTTDEIFKEGRKQGMTLILEDGIAKAKAGMVSLDELIRVTALKE